jgi:hypothetical protein
MHVPFKPSVQSDIITVNVKAGNDVAKGSAHPPRQKVASNRRQPHHR